MNSITRYLTPDSISATLKHVRSGFKGILFIVEGDCDIALFSSALEAPRSTFISCNGKDRLMAVYGSLPNSSIDAGMVFLRDADFDEIRHQEDKGSPLYVSDRYDFEMSLLEGRIFSRILSEHAKTKANAAIIADAFSRISAISSEIGALRKYAALNRISICFEDADFRFVEGKDLSIDRKRMVRYFLLRSDGARHLNVDVVTNEVGKLIEEAPSHVAICCGKDFLEIMSTALHKTYALCKASDCTPTILTSTLRISTHRDDVARQTLWPLLTKHIKNSGYAWAGASL